jgi:hypothetical protein
MSQITPEQKAMEARRDKLENTLVDVFDKHMPEWLNDFATGAVLQETRGESFSVTLKLEFEPIPEEPHCVFVSFAIRNTTYTICVHMEDRDEVVDGGIPSV